MFSNSFKIKRS